MANTPHLGITLLEQSQAQKEVTVNEAFHRIDAVLNSGAIDKDLATPPATPAQGDAYIVAASPTDAWSGKAGQLAYFDQVWRFIAPNAGLMVWVIDEEKHYVFDGSDWVEVVYIPSTGSGDMEASTYDPANIAQQVVGTTATQTLSNKTLSAPVINGILSGNAVPKLCHARLTLTSGVPVTTSDVLAATSLYVTPYGGNQMALYDGTTWKLLSFTEITHSLSGLTGGKPYDVFAYIHTGAVAIESLVWTNDTTRATALALQDGAWVKSGDATRRYLGTFYTSATGQCEDSAKKRYVYNYHHRMTRHMDVTDTTATWNYSTAAYQQANNSSANQLDFVQGLAEDGVQAQVVATVLNSTLTPRVVRVGIGVDSSSVSSARGNQSTFASNWYGYAVAHYSGMPGVGRHTLRWLEYGAGADTQVWQGNSLSGITGNVRA